MIVGCYTLDLYCDVCWEDTSYPYERRKAFPHQFTGQKRKECGKEARAAGWILRFVAGSRQPHAICPDCNKEGKRPMRKPVPCSRTACTSQRAKARHTQSGRLYCISCARKINAHNPGLVVAEVRQ